MEKVFGDFAGLAEAGLGFAFGVGQGKALALEFGDEVLPMFGEFVCGAIGVGAREAFADKAATDLVRCG